MPTRSEHSDRYLHCRWCGAKSDGLAVDYDVISDVDSHNHDITSRSANESGWTVYTGADLLDLRTVPWEPMCAACADRRSTYYIDRTRIRTVEQALDWTLHLAGKRWYADTNWPTVVRDLFPKARDAA